MTVAGWYRGPGGSGQQRYFDGTTWSDQFASVTPPSNPPSRAPWVVIGVVVLVFGGCATLAAIGSPNNEKSSVSSSATTVPGLAPELRQDFTAASNGTPVSADSGHAWTLTHIGAGTPVISGGRFIDPDTSAAVSAAYLTAQLNGRVTYLEADFAFGASGSTGSQVAALIAWSTNLPSGHIGAIPDSPCHLVFGNGGFSYQMYSGGSLIELGYVPYPARVGTGLQHVEVAIDWENSQAFIRDPTGKITRFSHALIGSIKATYACSEVFYSAANTDRRIAFSRFAASSARVWIP
jgi:hypothetical protein